ncbi:MAG: hypothetical protein DWQ29_03670 [Planctomycetota bacterium]|nr:MAG: hypothetical protein DWQ29_03670 [Planctomycetota bacterium]
MTFPPRLSRFGLTLAAIFTITHSPLPAFAESSLGAAIEEFLLQDYRGREYALSEFDDSEVVVVAFLGTECPLAKLYGPRLQELADEYRDRKVAFIAVNSNVQDSIAELSAYARRHGLTMPVLKDPGNKVADLFGARRTPEVFVLDRNRVIRYQGRVDDQYVIGVVRDEPTRTDLKIAIDEVLDGKAVTVSQTDPIGCIIGRVREVDADSDITYSNQIARIFKARCVECHRDGEIAPFTLTTYEDVAGWGEMIAEVVEQGRMPPWHAAPEHGTFLNNRRLSDEERQLIFQWVDAGCPQGDPAELPEPPEFTAGWQLDREPDLIVDMADEPFPVPADAGPEGVKYKYFTVDPNIDEDLWFTASEVRPGVSEVVHHIIVYARPEGSRGRRHWVFLSAYVPGLRVTALPERTAKRIPAGFEFVFEVHYTPNGSPHEDLSRIGFILTDAGNVDQEVKTMEVANAAFRIPPGDPNYEVTAKSGASPVPLTLLSMSPHMHLRGKSFRYELIHTDGTREVLLDVPRYDFNWQTRYVLAEPMVVPAGARMFCTAAFDNSADNLANPDPNKTVRWGDQSWDEMMIGYFDVIIPRRDSEQPAQPNILLDLSADRIFGAIDKDGNDAISREEAKPFELLHATFDRVDTDSDGLVQKSELENALTKVKQAQQK